MQFANSNFIYNADRGFIFAYVPKVACSNWKCILRYLEGHENYLDTKFAHDRNINGLNYLMDEKDPWALLDDPDIKKITFVRNPFGRCLSAYLNKIEFNLPKLGGEPDPKNVFLLATAKIDTFRKENLDEARYPGISLEVFLYWLKLGPKWLTENEHWRSQTDLTLVDRVKYDFIGRFENLEADAKHVLDLMGCDIDFPTQTDINFTPTSATQKIKQYYDNETAELLRSFYKEDFSNFDYSSALAL